MITWGQNSCRVLPPFTGRLNSSFIPRAGERGDHDCPRDLPGVNLPLDAEVDVGVTGNTVGADLGHDSDPLENLLDVASLSAICGDGELRPPGKSIVPLGLGCHQTGELHFVSRGELPLCLF